MFTDLVESTSMAEALDPEALAAVLGRYFGDARSIVEAHGGTVEKFVGDAVVAMFGIKQVREDDALRAVRTALELRGRVEQLNDELEPVFGVRLRLRTGINTGEVLVDDTHDDSLAVGHAISMAARLEQAAGPDEVVAGEPTLRLVAAGVDAVELEPQAVKGSSAPLRTWRIDGLRTTPTPGWHAGGTYVGRTPELAQVASSYARVVAEVRSAAALVVAPPGIGKTRFGAEVSARLEPAPRVLIGRGHADGGSTYGPLNDVLRQVGAGEETDRLEVTLAPLPDAPQVARAARALVAGTGVATSGEVAWILRRVASAVGSDAPLLLVLDDLHWTDPLLLDVIAELVEPPMPAPVFVLGMTRPELLEDHAAWLARIPSVPVIRLPPLSTEDTGRLVGERLGADADPDHRRRVVEAAAGVPLFVEQLAALDAESTGEAVPSTIRALMAARVDRISGETRTVLEIAAIAGEAFTRSDVVDGRDVDPELEALVRREILRRASSADGYRFGHALLRDAVIDAIPRRRRAELHERRAALLEAARDVDLEQVGFHLEAAWRERTAISLPDIATRALAERAAEALTTLGRRSLARKEWHRAAATLRRATDLVADTSDVRLTILPDLLDALVFAREIDEATAVHEEGLRRASNDPAAHARIEVAWARILPITIPADASAPMLAIADAAIPVFEAIGDDVWLGRAWMLRAMGLEDLDAAIEALQRTRILAERSGDERTLIEVWDELGGSLIGARTPWPEILEFARAEVAWARAHGVAFTEADGTLGEAYALAALGESDAALRDIAAASAMFDTLPSVVGQAGEALLLESRIRHDDGDFQTALELRTRAIATFAAAGEPRWEVSARIAHAHSLIDVGRFDEATAAFDEVERSEDVRGTRLALVLVGRARLAVADGRPDDALGSAAEAQALIDDRPHNATLLIRAHEELGRLYEALDRRDLATVAFEKMRIAAETKDDRVAHRRLKAQGVEIATEVDESGSGRDPAH